MFAGHGADHDPNLCFGQALGRRYFCRGFEIFNCKAPVAAACIDAAPLQVPCAKRQIFCTGLEESGIKRNRQPVAQIGKDLPVAVEPNRIRLISSMP
ncbi:hypothetical protein, partial [Leisingera sp. F5]|uniref:hypothetical protein n=1 Tax=Leisingera sp. F5 TaxID=1813816 RepID=UPI0025C440DE